MTTPGSTSPAADVLAEVCGNILAQPIDPSEPAAGTVRDLALPEPFVVRVADRVIRSTFEERHREVFEDRRHAIAPPSAVPVQPERERWSALRGYRPALCASEPEWPDRFPSRDAPPGLRAAARLVAERLARDGLPATLAGAVLELAPLLRGRGDTERVKLFRSAGVPIDLAEFFRVDDAPLVSRLLSRIDAGASPSELRADASRAEFVFRQTCDGFRGAADSGAHVCSLVHMQMTRASHWDGEGGGRGSGDNLDILLQLVEKLPGAGFVVTIDAGRAEELRSQLESAAAGGASRVRVAPSELPVSQWAQDNIKPGVAGGRRVALAPRFASRAEEGAKYVAGDSAALRSLGGAEIAVAHSPLHFQGGNLMIAERPSGERLLLVGEAEIARNVSLGLTAAQAIDALRIEMGAARAEVLPAVSFHLDYEISLRAVDDRLVAFVNDEQRAAEIIIGCGVRAMEGARVVGAGDARVLRALLEQRSDEQLLARLGAILAHVADPSGNFPASFADLFRAAPPNRAESGIGNLRLLLAAIDLVASRAPRPWEPSLYPHARAAIESLRRRSADRAAMIERLQQLGLQIVPVPGLSNDRRSATLINALQLPGRMLVPVRGGLLKPLDDAAISVLRRAVGGKSPGREGEGGGRGGVEIVGVAAAESERRGGSLHCSVALFPDPNA